MEYVIVPLASRDTALELKRRLKGMRMVVLPILGYIPDRRAIERALAQVKGGDFRSIFTSKTAVKVLWRRVRKDPGLARKIYGNSMAIGPSTAIAISKLCKGLGISPSVLVPERHNSQGILESLEEGRRYVLWCSESVNRVLADAMMKRGDLVAPIYRIGINEKMFGRLNSILSEYERKYLIFTSASSWDAWDRFMRAFPLPDGEMYAIAISKRVAARLGKGCFKRIYVYEQPDLTLFPEFVREVVLA